MRKLLHKSYINKEVMSAYMIKYKLSYLDDVL